MDVFLPEEVSKWTRINVGSPESSSARLRTHNPHVGNSLYAADGVKAVRPMVYFASWRMHAETKAPD